MDKEQSLSIARRCAVLYNNNLANKNFLVLHRVNDAIHSIELECQRGNFVHLTGLNPVNISASIFYKKLVNNKAKLSDFEMKKDGTTALKLSVLENMMDFSNGINMIGNISSSSLDLHTEKLMGNIYACLGFVQIPNGCYVPNTVLKKDMRIITEKFYRVVAILSKHLVESKYGNVVYEAKGVSINSIDMNVELKSKIKLLEST
jgi:hypothetical protein